MDINEIEKLGKQAIVNMAEEEIKKDHKSFDKTKFDKITVYASNKTINVRFQISLRYTPLDTNKTESINEMLFTITNEGKFSTFIKKNVFIPGKKLKDVLASSFDLKNDSIDIVEKEDHYTLSVNHTKGTDGYTGGAEGYVLDKKTNKMQMTWHEHPVPIQIPFLNEISEKDEKGEKEVFKEIKDNPAPKPIPRKPTVLIETRSELDKAWKSFEKRYPNPIFDERISTYFKSLSIIFVYDKSEQAKDPLIPRAWLELDSGEKIYFDESGIKQAFAKIGFKPNNEKDAIESALLYFKSDDKNRVLYYENTPDPATLVDKGILQKHNIQKPKISKENDVYIIELYTFYKNVEPKWYNRPEIKGIYKHIFKIGPSIYDVKSNELWSSENNLNKKE